MKPEPVEVPGEAPPPRNLGVFDLRRATCRWPVNDGRPEYLFCGHAAHPGSCYCAFHYRLSVARRA